MTISGTFTWEAGGREKPFISKPFPELSPKRTLPVIQDYILRKEFAIYDGPVFYYLKVEWLTIEYLLIVTVDDSTPRYKKTEVYSYKNVEYSEKEDLIKAIKKDLIKK